MNEKNDSLLEIASMLMRRKKKPQTLDSILDEVLEKKGIEDADEQLVAQFEVDFMLSGIFIYCGEDKKGNQLWDLKERQPSSLLDKDGGYLEDMYKDDEDVIKNELKDDFSYNDKNIDELINDDDDISDEEDDDIKEGLGLVDDESESEEISSELLKSDDDEEDEDEEEVEEDDIEAALRALN